MNANTPSQTPLEFFSSSEVKALIDVQKRNPWGSEPHRRAFDEIKSKAKAIGVDVEKYFGSYED